MTGGTENTVPSNGLRLLFTYLTPSDYTVELLSDNYGETTCILAHAVCFLQMSRSH